jgi:hypothetical protein
LLRCGSRTEARARTSTPKRGAYRVACLLEIPALGLGNEPQVGEAVHAQIVDFDLSAGEMARLDGLDRSGGTPEAMERKWW